jgi:hypothetical protein
MAVERGARERVLTDAELALIWRWTARGGAYEGLRHNGASPGCQERQARNRLLPQPQAGHLHHGQERDGSGRKDAEPMDTTSFQPAC